MLAAAASWPIEAKIVPLIVGCGALLFGLLAAANEIVGPPEGAPAAAGQTIHMDVVSHVADLPTATKLVRGAAFFGWIASFLAAMAAIGLIPTVPLFIIAYMRLEGRERWSIVLPMAAAMTLFIYALFDQILAIPWPPSYLGTWVPALKAIPSV